MIDAAARPDDGAISQDALAYLRILHLAGRQEAGHGVDRRIPVVEAAGMKSINTDFGACSMMQRAIEAGGTERQQLGFVSGARIDGELSWKSDSASQSQ